MHHHDDGVTAHAQTRQPSRHLLGHHKINLPTHHRRRRLHKISRQLQQLRHPYQPLTPKRQLPPQHRPHQHRPQHRRLPQRHISHLHSQRLPPAPTRHRAPIRPNPSRANTSTNAHPQQYGAPPPPTHAPPSDTAKPHPAPETPTPNQTPPLARRLQPHRPIHHAKSNRPNACSTGTTNWNGTPSTSGNTVPTPHADPPHHQTPTPTPPHPTHHPHLQPKRNVVRTPPKDQTD